jgi:DNA-binding response OmpR family regulator
MSTTEDMLKWATGESRHPLSNSPIEETSMGESVSMKNEYRPIEHPGVHWILIAEDDSRLAKLLREYFVKHGFAVEIESRGARAVERIIQDRPALVILDLMLPDMSGFDVCRRVRGRSSTGILMLTASKAEVDQTVGLDLGADDYVVKPVEPRILLARVRSLLRRLGGVPSNAAELRALSAGGVTLDRDTRTVQVFGSSIELTMIEFDMLSLLIRYSGEVVTREQLCLQTRGVPYDGIDRDVDIHISRVRRKLEAHGFDASLLKCVRGLGYLFLKQ